MNLICFHSSNRSTRSAQAGASEAKSTALRAVGSVLDYRIDYSDSRLTMNGQSESWLSTMENELSLTFIPHRKWQWTVSGEHYRNELTEHNYKNVVMLDTKLTFQLNKKIEFAASLTNILNKQKLQLHHLLATLILRESPAAPWPSASLLDNSQKIISDMKHGSLLFIMSCIVATAAVAQQKKPI